MKLLNKIAWEAVLITKEKKKERKKTVNELNPDEISNVLAVSSTAIGDTLLSTPAVRAIRCILPNASIDFMVRKKFSVLFENNPDIRTIIPYYGGYKRLFSLLNRIKSGSYDLCLVFHDSDPCPVQAAYLAGIPFIARIGFKDETVAPFLNVRVPYRDEAHAIEQRLDVLRTLFKVKLDSSQDRRMVLPIMVGEAEAFWDNLLNGLGYNYAKNKRIGFQISASRPYKTWPHEHFSELGKGLLADSEDVNIILFGGPGDEKTGKKIAEGITTDPGQKSRIINLAGRLPLKKLPAALRGLDLFITNDTGPFHIAVALKTPTISLFVPSTVRHTGPYQDLEIHKVIKKPKPCSPCIQKYCDNPNCMSIISVEEVYQAAKTSLSQKVFSGPLPSQKARDALNADFDLEKLLSSNETLLVKKAARRRVYCNKDLFIKVFLLRSFVLRLRDPGKKEWTLAKALHQHGLTAPPLAHGLSKGRSYFVTQKIIGQEFESFLASTWPNLQLKKKREIIYAFYQLITGLSDAGLFQPDFHLNNVMYDPEKGRFFLIDLHRAHLHSRPLMTKERLKQLSYILPPFWGKVSRHEILRFVAILSHDWSELKERSLRFQVQEHAFSRMIRHWSKKGRRRIQGSLKQKRNNRRLLLSSRQTPNEVIRFIEDLSNKNIPIKKGAIKNSRHTMAVKIEIGGSPYFLKLYRCSGHLNACSYLFRTSRVIKAWNISWEFIVRQIPTPLPLAAVDTGDPWNEMYGAAIYVWSGAGRHNTDMIKRTLENHEAAPVFLSKLSGFVWEMHEKGVFHGDCKISNFYFNPSSPTKFKIFDLDGTKIKRRLSDKERLSDLINLCASLEWWRVRDKLTKEIFRYYTRRCINWAGRQDLLHLLETNVTEKIHKRKLRIDQEKVKGPKLYDF